MKTGKALSNIGENLEQRTVRRIANEFQTPLGVIISAGELLESYIERLTPERRRLALEDILCAARQMNSAMDFLTAVENESRENPKSTTLTRSTKRTPPNRGASRL
jgi:signal transduction histidine kinase